MRNWFVEQGAFMYVLLGLLVLGIVCSVIPAISYRRMIKEADLMGTSNHKLIKYIKLKFSSYFKLGMIPENTDALVNKYVDRYKIGPMSIHRWEQTGRILGIVTLIVGLFVSAYKYSTTSEIIPSITTLSLTVSAVLLLAVVRQWQNFRKKRSHLVWDIEDYLDNYLKNKLNSDESFAKEAVDPEYYGEALSEIAATNSRKRKKKASLYDTSFMDQEKDGDRDEIDAKIVEDVLREFLT